MYIIADSGSTKTQWCEVSDDGRCTTYQTAGINPVFQSEEDILILLNEEFPVHPVGIERIYFYGAGCAFPEKNEFVRKALAAYFNCRCVEVASDLMAAARSLCGKEPGIACIMGTGSNSCYYDGNEIVHNVPPLGYVLGDEGSGAVLGKKFLADVLKGVISAEIRGLFFKENPDYTYAELMNRVYRQPLPNRFMAGLTKFMKKYIEYPEIEKIVLDSFDEFIRRNIVQYEEAARYPISFTGSVGFYFKFQLEEQLKKHGLKPGSVSQVPMPGLIAYHSEK